MTATRAAAAEFRRVFHDPGRVGHELGQQERLTHYQMYWAWYSNDVYSDLKRWGPYLQRYGLYQHTRNIYNPVRRLVDFYAGAVYPGVLTIDADRLPHGVQQAIPLDAPDTVKAAVAQTWQWSNWQSQKQVLVRFGACAGDVLVEVVDDLDRRKVTYNIVWPALVTQVTLDATGNVKAYIMAYRARDEHGMPYLYRKEVDRTAFRYFKDDKPFNITGAGAVVRNPYGFVPAVWCKHTDLGGDAGASAIRSVSKLDELNSLAAHVHDQIHNKIHSPQIFWGEGNITKLFAPPTEATNDAPVGRDVLRYLKGPKDGRVESLAGDLNLADALPYMQQLMGEIEHDHPELSMYTQLRGMSQVTGPAAQRLLGDVQSLVTEAAANYDQQSVKLFQMALAIGGWRVNSGEWERLERNAGNRGLTPQQQKFASFDLTSYAQGQLDVTISPRPLIAPTAEERIMEQRAQLALDGDRAFVAGATGQPTPEDEAVRILGGG
jgi:hypothetical protein